MSQHDRSECCGGRAKPVRQIETQGFVGKTEQLHDKLLSGQLSSLQNMKNTTVKFNAAGPNGARLRNHQGASGALSVERAPIRPDTALAAWMFFFWRWAPPKLTRELPGRFLWPFLPSPSLFSQKELIDTDIDTDPVASDHLPSEPLTAPRLPSVKKTRLPSILFSATG